MDKNKILFSIYQTSNQSNGGVNSMTQILENDNTIQPVILTNRQGPFNQRWENRGWDVTTTGISWGDEYKKQSKVNNVIDLVKSNISAFRLLKKNNAQLLYCNDIQGFWCAYFGGAMAGKKVFFNLRDTKSAEEISSLKKWSFIAKKSDLIIVLSEEMKAFVVDKLLNGQNADKVEVTYSIVDHQLFFPVQKTEVDQIRSGLDLNPSDFVISYVAAFNEKKAQLPFIENVISRFKDTTNIKFCFIGDFNPDTNPYARECQQAAEKAGISHIIKFVGHDKKIDQWYKCSDVVAIASTKEGLARCMIESISCGTPVVSFDVCSANEILNSKECGEVVSMGDYDTFFDKINLLRQNADLRERYKANGVRISKQLFSKEEVMLKYKKIYNKMGFLL